MKMATDRQFVEEEQKMAGRCVQRGETMTADMKYK